MGDCNDVFVKGRDLEFVVIEVTWNLVFVRFGIDKFVEGPHVEFMSQIDHSIVPTH